MRLLVDDGPFKPGAGESWSPKDQWGEGQQLLVQPVLPGQQAAAPSGDARTMPVTTSCPAFVENAWKKDLCSNCFKGQEEHEAVKKEVSHKTLTAQDSLTDLQLGTGRYFTLTPQFAVNARYAQQVHKWNDTVVFPSRDSCESSSEGGSRGESADRSLGDSCQPESTAPQDSTMDSDVIERLDSLVLGTSASLGSLETGGSEEGSASRQGILKSPTRDKSEEKRRGITFPDYEELQEIIGYGGDMYYSSEDDEPKEVPEVKKHVSEFPDEMTEEERNVLNMTKQNTSFNSHAPNLKDPRSSPAPRLGVDKKHTPIISVRPFVREQKPGKVNMVSPMINGELVSSRGLKDSSSLEVGTPPSNSLFGSSVLKLAEGEEGSSRGEAKTLKQDSLGSDGSTENSSSDSDSLTRDSPPPSEISLSAFDMKHKDNPVVSNKDASYTKQASFLASQIEEQKAKSSAATERLSFLSSQSSPAGEGLSSQKVKPSNYKDEHVTKLTAAKAKLSLPNKNSSLEPEEEEEVSVGEDLRAKCSAATARLSFLNSTMGEATSSPPPPPPPPGPAVAVSSSRVISQDKGEEGQGKETNVPSQAKSQPKSKVEKVVERDASAEVPAASEATGPKRNDSSRESPKVKLTRKSPYVVGPYASTAILKGPPKPMITRKPPILKDKPKVPLKPNKLMMRSPSSSPSPSPCEEPKRAGMEYRSPASSPTRSYQSGSTSSRSSRSPVAAPRKASFRQSSEYVNLNLAHSSDSMETGGEPGGETRALVIAVSGAETKTTEPTELRRMSGQTGSEVSVSTSENSPPQVQKNLALKNKEALEAIRKSLSHKLINSSPPARVMESIKALENGSTSVAGGGQVAAQRTTSNSFEEARSSIADALQFRHENAARPAAKRQAPKPPEEDEDLEEELLDDEEAQREVEEEEGLVEEKETRSTDVGLNETPAVGEEDKPAETGEEVKESVEPRLAPAIRNSSMKSADSCKNKDSKPRSVQFSPETVTVTVPSVQPSPKVISYNRWMHHRPQNPYLESSFTGQPIAMFPPGVISHPGPTGKKQTPLPLYAPAPIIDDEPRKWTEKKNKWRSKSTPRSSEIDEIMGSSKTKSSSRMGIFSPSSPQPIKRQSRVEIYESERKGLQQKKGKFSLKKLFRGSLPEGLEEVSDNKFIDKEHEREILERQKVKVRPEIIHPLDLLNGGVEVVKIIPQNSGKGGHEKHKGGSRSNDKTVGKRPANGGESRAKSDSDSKDSGHDTSSIHTDTSEGSGGSSGDRATDFSLSPLGAVPQVSASYIFVSSLLYVLSYLFFCERLIFSQTTIYFKSCCHLSPASPPSCCRFKSMSICLQTSPPRSHR